MTSFRWPPYRSPPWLAAYAVGAGAWVAFYALDGWTLVAVVAGVGGSLVARLLWWLRTETDREARRWLARWRAEAGLGGDES